MHRERFQHDAIAAEHHIFSSADACSGNAYGQNESAAEQKCGISIPGSQGLRQKPPGDVPGAGDLRRQKYRRQGRAVPLGRAGADSAR